MQGGYNGPTLGRRKTVMHPIDLAQALRDTFGYAIAEISAPPPEDPARIAERILALPPDADRALSSQQQDAINDVLVAMAKQPTLSDADVDFLRRVIADNRVTEAKLGIVLQNMFRKYTIRLERLIPVVLDRISSPNGPLSIRTRLVADQLFRGQPAALSRQDGHRCRGSGRLAQQRRVDTLGRAWRRRSRQFGDPAAGFEVSAPVRGSCGVPGQRRGLACARACRAGASDVAEARQQPPR
jgi:hypothetical protein